MYLSGYVTGVLVSKRIDKLYGSSGIRLLDAKEGKTYKFVRCFATSEERESMLLIGIHPRVEFTVIYNSSRFEPMIIKLGRRRVVIDRYLGYKIFVEEYNK